MTLGVAIFVGVVDAVRVSVLVNEGVPLGDMDGESEVV